MYSLSHGRSLVLGTEASSMKGIVRSISGESSAYSSMSSLLTIAIYKDFTGYYAGLDLERFRNKVLGLPSGCTEAKSAFMSVCKLS